MDYSSVLSINVDLQHVRLLESLSTCFTRITHIFMLCFNMWFQMARTSWVVFTIGTLMWPSIMCIPFVYSYLWQSSQEITFVTIKICYIVLVSSVSIKLTSRVWNMVAQVALSIVAFSIMFYWPSLVRFHFEWLYLQSMFSWRILKDLLRYLLGKEGVTAPGGHAFLAHTKQKVSNIVGLTALRLAFFMGYE